MTGNTQAAHKPGNGSSRVNFHYGNTLLKLANTYVSLHEAVLEAVQNAIDAEAKNILISINRKTRAIEIADNGAGVSREKFEEALSRVCHSMKKTDKLGQFGLGLISPLNKCELFTFTSKGREGYLEWTFDTDAISRQAQYVDVPCVPRKFVYEQSGKAARAASGTRLVEWRTKVAIQNYVVDREISRIQSAEALKDAIVEKFGVAMRRNDVVVGVRIVDEHGVEEIATGKAKRFSGKKLPEVVIEEKDAGKTTFRLFLAKKSTAFGFRGKVVVGLSDNDYRFAFAQFAKSAGYLPDEIVELFKSGVFEGEIITTKPKLHDSRRAFERNDALVGFCTVIEQWYGEHGKKYLKEAKEQRQGERIQRISLESLKTIESLLSSDTFEALRKQTIGSFRRGTVGEGHANPGEGKVVGTQKTPSVSTKASGSSGGSSGAGGHSNEQPDKEKPDHAPFTAAGPKGQHRTVVKGGSRGLQFDHVALGREGPPWILEPKDGTIFFNVENPEWVAASAAGDRELMQFQEINAVMALVHHTMPDDFKKVAELAYGDFIAPLSFLICNSPSFNLKARIKAKKVE